MVKPVLAWLVKATPWKDCPFDVKAICVTSEGPEKAQKMFKDAFKNDGLEITECVAVDVIKDELLKEDARCAQA